MPPLEITDYYVRRTGETIPVVTAIPPRELPAFMHARRGDPALRRHLRRLCSDGILVAPRAGRLQAKVRGRGLMYVFRGETSAVPRVREPRRRARVIYW